jgi:hypothetical protein
MLAWVDSHPGWGFSVHHLGVEKWTSVYCIVCFVFGIFLFNTGINRAWRLPASVQWAVTAKTLEMQC